LLQEAARKRPNDADLQFDAAKASYAMGQVSEAAEIAREALNPPAPMKLTTLSLTTNDEADPLSGASQPVFHASAEAKQFLELLAYAAKPVVPVPAMIEDVLRKDPKNVPGLMARAAGRELEAKGAAARQDYERVLALFPDFTPAKLKIAELAAALPGADAKAYDLAVQARSAMPGDPAAARALGILAYRQNSDMVRVVALLKQSLNSRPNDPQANLYLGLAQLKTNDKAGAKKSLQKAIAAGLSKEETAEGKKALEELK
jgi:tetratricopeptide (TPR) repeat protein